MHKPTICNYPTAAAAILVKNELARVIDVPLGVREVELTAADVARGVGRIAVYVNCEEDVPLDIVHEIGHLCAVAETRVLANYLHKAGPEVKTPSLIQAWWLRPAHFDKLPRYKFMPRIQKNHELMGK
jgi:hypothetical protein